MRNQFFITYNGNKYEESKKHLKYTDYDAFNHIIEPYGGSYGFSRFLFEQDVLTKRQKKRKFTIYDNNEDLINFYNKLKNMNVEQFQTFINGYNDIMNNDEYKLEGNHTKKLLNTKIIMSNMNKHHEYKTMLNFNTTCGRFNSIIKKNCGLYYNMLQYCEFIHGDVRDIIFEDKNKTLIYLDPPYILSCNTQYADPGIDHSEFIHNLMMSKKKTKVMFVHSYHYLLSIVFKKYKKNTYEKRYNNTKRIVTHDVFMS
jgi:site-specific DNA-adenine methylase